MTPAELDAIRERLEKASPGPWRACAWDPLERPHVVAETLERYCNHLHDLPRTKADADFIVAARTDIPALLEEVERLTAGRDEWKQQHENLLAVRDQDLRALFARIDQLRSALGALGVIGGGYCFCRDRDPDKAEHEPECRDAREALKGGR